MKKRRRKKRWIEAKWSGAAAVSLLLLAIFWGDLIRVLSLEWSINEQYRFGYLVPFITLYLLYLRWLGRPRIESGKSSRFPIQGLLWVTVLLLFPLKIIWESNPDWRMVYWVQALLIYAASWAFLVHLGGKSWANWFAPALAIFLFAVPWPMQFEQNLTQGLMRMVAAITVDMMNLLGFFAQQEGNLIQLANGWVGVEEACSGVRSFQSTIMAAYFLGEMFRYRLWLRLVLIVFGSLVSVLLNVGRTFLLTYITYKDGGDVMQTWHDPVGYLVSFSAFIIILGLALVINQLRRKGPPTRPAAHPLDEAPLNWLGPRKAATLIIICLLSYPLSSWWFRRGNPPETINPPVASVEWSRADSNVEFGKIPSQIRSILRYSEGTQASWHPRENEKWLAYYFVWEEGKISSFADVHKPEICLPAAGFQLTATDKPLLWEKEGLRLTMKSYTFSARGQNVHVFFGVWNDNQNETIIPMARTSLDRLRAAFAGNKIKGRRSLEIIVTGVNSIAKARAQAKDFLERAMVVQNGRS